MSPTKSGGWVMILYASALHWGWAVTTLVADSATGATPIAGIAQLCRDMAKSRWWDIDPTMLLFYVLLFSGVLAVIGGWRVPSLLGVAMMLPQQFVLTISTLTTMQAVTAGMYADGVVRPWPFILADQLPSLLAAPLYTAAVLACHLSEEEPMVRRR